MGKHAPMVSQQKGAGRLQPKLKEAVGKRAKMVAKFVHENLTWKKILMSWMVLLVASKMVLLMLTYEFFSLTALISLQIFHGVWTIAFFCLNVIDSRAILPNASCLLAGYLPATTVLHILLIPNDYPLEFIIIDAVGTFLAIITMFLLLRMECTEILHEAEELWQRQGSTATSQCGSGSDASSECGASVASGSTGASNVDFNEHYIHASRIIQAARAAEQCRQSTQPPASPTGSSVIQGNRVGPTVISVSHGGHAAATATANHLDSMLYTSMDEPHSQSANFSCTSSHVMTAMGAGSPVATVSSSAGSTTALGGATVFRTPSAASSSWRHNLNFPAGGKHGGSKAVLTAAAAPRCPPSPIMAQQGPRDALEDMVVYDEAVDLEPIDFEHFIDEPAEPAEPRMFKISRSSSSSDPDEAQTRSRGKLFLVGDEAASSASRPRSGRH